MPLNDSGTIRKSPQPASWRAWLGFWLPRRGWVPLLLGSLALHAMVTLCFAVKWDKAAMITVIPFTLWCAAGFSLAAIAMLWRRNPPALATAALWLATFLLSDELRAWRNWGVPPPQPARPMADASSGGRVPLRLVSLNIFKSIPAAAEVAAWNPDIVFLQEVEPQHDAAALAKALFGDQALVATRPDCAILARGKAMQVFDFQWPVPLPGGIPWAVCTRLILPDGRPVDLLNMHLLPAEKNWRLWSRDAWRAHAANRRDRRFQLALLLSSYQSISAQLPPAPLIVGGDFNAPARDASLLSLPASGLRDSYDLASSRQGNTYPNSFPLHRIDQCWFSPGLLPIRHAAIETIHSDHRMVVVDFLYP